MLWRAICDADRPLYCDTDSITAVSFGKDVNLSKDLGDWELEYTYDRVIVCGKKLYAMHSKQKRKCNSDTCIDDEHWKIASKGARLNHKELIEIAAGKIVQYNSIAPTFSMAKSKPTFISREIQITASDIRFVPRAYDPKFNPIEEME
jgi:hypothetical protein